MWTKKNGEQICVRESARVVLDDDGKVIYYEGMIEDITARIVAEDELKRNLERLEKAIEQTVSAMAKMIETRDPYTAGHQQRVAVLAVAIAEEMGLRDADIMALQMAAAIHDVGKIYVPAEILSRPGQLSETEFNLIKAHPQIGFQILKPIEFPWPVAEIVLQHHESLNGAGYPQQLSGDQIMMTARILRVADVVEAMVSHRPYRPARTLEATLDEIVKYQGILYDVDAVTACVRLFREKNFKFQ
jgi:putative nucleotidyltransferase with HDIG domain